MRTLKLRSGMLAILLGAGCAAGMAQDSSGKHPITFSDLMSMHRVAGATISADGKWIAYAVSTPDMEANRNAGNIWIVPATGGTAIQLTQSGHDSAPAWSPDGKTLAFMSSRDGTSQVYALSMDGGESHAITHLSSGADMVKWSARTATGAQKEPAEHGHGVLIHRRGVIAGQCHLTFGMAGIGQFNPPPHVGVD